MSEALGFTLNMPQRENLIMLVKSGKEKGKGSTERK
jgi:hypothetical protein